MLWHDDLFTLPNGKKEKLLKAGRFVGKFIIQHPYFHFYPPTLYEDEENKEDNVKIYLQQFEILTKNDLFSVTEFASMVEKNCHLENDYVFWYETGFWSIILNGDLYMGMGLLRLDEILSEEGHTKFALCLSNNTSITIINSKIDEEDKVILSVYASNELIPFAEVLEPFRKTVKKYDYVKVLKSEILPEKVLRRIWSANRLIDLNPIAFVMDKESQGYKRLPIIKNPFRKVKDPVVRSLYNITGITSGGFIESDYYGGRKFLPYAIIWDLTDVAVVEFHFRQYLGHSPYD